MNTLAAEIQAVANMCDADGYRGVADHLGARVVRRLRDDDVEGARASLRIAVKASRRMRTYADAWSYIKLAVDAFVAKHGPLGDE